MKFFRVVDKFVLVALLGFLVYMGACASLATPKSFDQRLAYAYATNTAVRATAADFIIRGKISKQGGREILQKTDTVATTLGIARQYNTDGKPVDAVTALQAAELLLLGLQTQLK